MAKLKLRRATMADKDFLFRLKNDPESLRWSWVHEPVTPSAHASWLEKALYFDDPKIYIGLVDKIPVGTVRTRYCDEGDEVSITVAPEHRGKGYGTAMLKALPKELPLVAYIDIGNEASRRAFEKAGFEIRYKAVKK